MSISGGLGLAILVNRRIRAVGLIRAIFFVVVIMVVTLVLQRSSRRWVHYQAAVDND